MRVSNRMVYLGMLAWTAQVVPLSATARTPISPAQAASTAPADAPAAMRRNIQMMHEQMAKLHVATDPELRARLLDEHLKTMQGTMALMMASNRSGCVMGPGAMHSSGMRGNGPGGANMMQMMMEQMVQHQNAMRGPGR